MNRVFVPLPNNEDLAARLASACGYRIVECTFHQFPDGETYVRTPQETVGAEAILVCTLDRPNAKFLPLNFIASHLREMGVGRIGLVTPYLPYLRQDQRFNPGEAITSKIFAKLLSETVNSVFTVDPHLHRYDSLADIYTIPTQVVHAAPAIASWIRRHIDKPVVVGPDVESKQWVEAVARKAEAPYTVLTKTRRGDRDIEIEVPDRAALKGRTPILVDDIISTAHTMIETARRLTRIQSRPPVCIGVHAVFAGNAFEELEQAGVKTIATCNTIPHFTNRIDIVPALAETLIQRFDEPCRSP